MSGREGIQPCCRGLDGCYVRQVIDRLKEVVGAGRSRVGKFKYSAEGMRVRCVHTGFFENLHHSPPPIPRLLRTTAAEPEQKQIHTAFAVEAGRPLCLPLRGDRAAAPLGDDKVPEAHKRPYHHPLVVREVHQGSERSSRDLHKREQSNTYVEVCIVARTKKRQLPT